MTEEARIDLLQGMPLFGGVDADTVRGNVEIDITERLRFSFSASTSRQERAYLPPFWQTTLSSGVTLRF